nr:TonB family protein [Candidatus Cloacimonadota bacterium]
WNYLYGHEVKQNTQEALRLLDAAAEKGSRMYLGVITDYYLSGNEKLKIGRDYNKAFKYASIQAREGRIRAQFILGECYYFGWGAAQNLSEAYFWYYQAASDDDPYVEIETEYARDYVAELEAIIPKDELPGLNARAEDYRAQLAIAEAKRKAEAEAEAQRKAAEEEYESPPIELVDIPMEERERLVDSQSGDEVRIYLTGLEGNSDSAVSIRSRHHLRSRAGIFINANEPEDAREGCYLTLGTDIFTRICLKRDGRIAFNYDDAMPISSTALKDRLIKLKKSHPNIIFCLAFEDEDQIGAMVDLVKLVRETEADKIMVRKAGPDPVEREPETLPKYEQALLEIGNIRSTTRQTEKEDPPFLGIPYDDPPIVLGQIVPVYPDFAKRARVQGTVVLSVDVRRDGSVREIRVQRSVTGLDDAAIEAVKKVRFQPGKAGGEPVDTTVIIPIEFRLN